jgi:hypothetical protein
MIGAFVVMPALVIALAAMTIGALRMDCESCGTCKRCTGLTVGGMIRARMEPCADSPTDRQPKESRPAEPTAPAEQP